MYEADHARRSPSDGQAATSGSPSPSTPEPDGAFNVIVNGAGIVLDDAKPTGRQVLSAAGLDPADDYVLILLLKHGTRSIGLDELVDLRAAGAEMFRAFESDRVFRFTVDGRGYEWGTAILRGEELYGISGVTDDYSLVLERSDVADLTISRDGKVDLSDPGSERFRRIKAPITVSIDGALKQIPRGVYTTEELLVALGVAAGYLLNVLNAAGQLETLQAGQETRPSDGMKFFSQVPCGASS